MGKPGKVVVVRLLGGVGEKGARRRYNTYVRNDYMLITHVVVMLCELRSKLMDLLDCGIEDEGMQVGTR